MRVIEVKVVPKSSWQRVEVIDTDRLKVWVHAAPEKGRANQEVRTLLAKHFALPRSKIKLIKSEHSRTKTFALDTSHDSHNIKDLNKEARC